MSPENRWELSLDDLLYIHAVLEAAYCDIQRLMRDVKEKLKLPTLAKLGFAADPVNPRVAAELSVQTAAVIDDVQVACSIFTVKASFVFGDAYIQLSRELGGLQPLPFYQKLCSDNSTPKITPSFHTQILLFVGLKARLLKQAFGVSDDASAEQLILGIERFRRDPGMEWFCSEQHGLNSDTLAMMKLEFVNAQAVLQQRKAVVPLPSGPPADGDLLDDKPTAALTSPIPSTWLSVDGNVVVRNGVRIPVEPHEAEWCRILLEAYKQNTKVPGQSLADLNGGDTKNLSRDIKALKKKLDLATALRSAKGPRGGYWLVFENDG